MLYLINQRITQEAIGHLKHLCQRQDAILLLGEAITLAMSDTTSAILLSLTSPLFALEHDVAQYGVTNGYPKDIILVDYETFVKLTMDHPKIINWK